MGIELVAKGQESGGKGDVGDGELKGEQNEVLRAQTAKLLAERQYFDDLGAKTRAEAGEAEHREDSAKAAGQTALAQSKVEVKVQELLLNDAEYLKLRVDAVKSALRRDIARNESQAKIAAEGPQRPRHDGRRGGTGGGAIAEQSDPSTPSGGGPTGRKR